MIIHFSINRELFFSKIANDTMDRVREIFAKRNGQGRIVELPHLSSSLEYQHEGEAKHFEALWQAEKLIVLPCKWNIDDNQKWELKIYEVLCRKGERKVFVVMPNETIVRAQFVKGGQLKPLEVRCDTETASGEKSVGG